jgi:hypothetical protein
MRPFRLIGDIGNFRGVLAGRALDRRIDVLAREVLRFRVGDGDTQSGIGFRFGPPSLAASVIDFASFGNTLDIVAQRDSLARRRHSKALPMVDENY